jgi:hypothetical protein
MTVTSPASTSVLNTKVPVVAPLDSDVGFVTVDHDFGFTGAAQQLIFVAARVLTAGQFISQPSPCGNCSYSISFNGPTWQCIQVDPLVVEIPDLGLPSPPLGPFYGVDSFMSNIQANFNRSEDQGFWIAYGLPPDNFIHCTLYNATYTTQVQYTSDSPIVNTTIQSFQQVTDAAINGYTIIKSNKTSNAEANELWTLQNYYAIHNAVGRLLLGGIEFRVGYGLAYLQTILGFSDMVQISRNNVSFPADFTKRLERYFVNTVLSLTHFLQSPPVPQIEGSDVRSPAAHATTEATVITYPARYTYSAGILWRSYGIAVGCSTLCILVGCHALFSNGVDADMSFSQILVTTRNVALDRLCDGESLGGENISKKLLKTPLRYGEERRNEGHACFGFDSEVTTLMDND